MTPTFSNSTLPVNSVAITTVSNLASGGAVGTAAATVDNYQVIEVSQTTAAQTLTLPTPTGNKPSVVYVSNTGSVSFTMYQKVIFPGTAIGFYFPSSIVLTQGRVWIPLGGVSATITTTTTV